MVRKKSLWCRECDKRTPHAYVGRETLGSDIGGPMRLLLAVTSFGMSEMTHETHWQCERCGNIRAE